MGVSKLLTKVAFPSLGDKGHSHAHRDREGTSQETEDSQNRSWG